MSRRSKRVGVYPGSFDPIHNGHVDVIQRCRTLFEEVYVAVLCNDEKRPLFSVEERVTMIRQLVADWEGCKVESFSGLLVHFMDKVGGQTIVRGLRAVSDFEYEFQMGMMNRRLSPNVETVFMIPAEDYSYLSSRLIKQVCALGGDVTGLVPVNVLEHLRSRLLPGEGTKPPSG